jgi:hypothetical protein
VCVGHECVVRVVTTVLGFVAVYRRFCTIYKRTISVVMHVCPSVRPFFRREQLGSQSTDYNNIIFFFFPGATQPIVSVYFTALYRALASSRTRLLDHTQRRATVGWTPLNE